MEVQLKDRMGCRLVVIGTTDKQECEDPPSSFKYAVWENFSVAVTTMTTYNDEWIVQKLYGDIAQLLLDM